jgi:uncharacterized phage-associated protein
MIEHMFDSSPEGANWFPVSSSPEGDVQMAVSAHNVAAILRDRLPGVPVKKLHKLLYYCQGHHLAAFGEPLFPEAVSAWDTGPVVGQLWQEEKVSGPRPPDRRLDEIELATIDYVVGRYGSLTAADLENLTHSEGPWRGADLGRPVGGKVRIELDWLASYFRNEGAPGRDEEGRPEAPTVSGWLADSGRTHHDAVRPGEGFDRAG